LVVDDEKSICLSLKDYFSRNGFIVDTAQEVEEAEQLIENCNYEVIIQDLRMGPSTTLDGLELIRLAYQRSAETRIVVLTAYGSAEDESEAKRWGADAFLRKPQPLSQIAQVVRGVMESPRHQKTPYS
jgi:DNA-binding response OmpR family regulator